MHPDYTYATVGGMYAGKWLVIRISDQRIMTESHDPYECVAWIKTWAYEPHVANKRGRELAPRFIEAVRHSFPDFLT